MRGSSPPKVAIGDSPADLAAATNSPRLKDTAANFGDLPLLPDDGRILHLLLSGYFWRSRLYLI